MADINKSEIEREALSSTFRKYGNVTKHSLDSFANDLKLERDKITSQVKDAPTRVQLEEMMDIGGMLDAIIVLKQKCSL